MFEVFVVPLTESIAVLSSSLKPLWACNSLSDLPLILEPTHFLSVSHILMLEFNQFSTLVGMAFYLDLIVS